MCYVVQVIDTQDHLCDRVVRIADLKLLNHKQMEGHGFEPCYQSWLCMWKCWQFLSQDESLVLIFPGNDS